MKLDSYIREQGLTSAQFAKVAGISSKQTVHNYRHGIRFPSPGNLRRIREATKGAVTPDDFVDQHAVAAPRVKKKGPARGRAWDPIIGEAIAVAGGPKALAEMLGVGVTSLYSWQRIPPHRVLAVERATGIPRTRLRPDLYPPDEKGDASARGRAA